MTIPRFAVLFLALLHVSVASQENPIRKVVSMLQLMQQKVTAEGEKQEEAYNKFMCYCKTNGGDLSESIRSAKKKIEALTASIKEDTEKKRQLEDSLKEHTSSRDDAKDTMKQATALRQKEAGAFSKVKSDSETNLAALSKAIPLIEKGMAGSFLQTQEAGTVRAFAMERADLPDATREELLAFLSGGHEQKYVPQSGEIVGILKTLHDEMTASLGDATNEENGAIQNYESLIAAKSKEVATLQKQIEEEMTRNGNLAVKISGEENDREDTRESLSEDEKFKLDLATSCDTKTKDWELMKQTRSEELKTLAETIKVLNDDDALELFKKTLPSASMSLVQVQFGSSTLRLRAAAQVAKARSVARNGRMASQPQLDLLALALSGKKVGFEKVIAMIDNMVSNLKKEQGEDDKLKAYCEASFDKAEDKKKMLENSISDSEAALAEMNGALDELTQQIAQLETDVKNLDKAVADATALRQGENADYKQLMSDDATAKELLLFAKNRLNKFYNPKLYKPAPKRELTAEERITVNMGGTVVTPAPGGIAGTGIGAAFVQESAHAKRKGAPPPPPETFGPYSRKTEEGNGVVAMVDLLVADLDKEMQEADVSEKNAQEEYEAMMKDSAAKRAADSKSIADKTSEKASTEEALQSEGDAKAGTSKEHMNTMKHISSLHGECDFLLQYFDVRKQARADEVESLANAKAALSGADYALLQQGRLRGIAKHTP